MKFILFVFSITVSFALFYGCTKKIDMNIPESDRKMVLNAFIYKDSIVRVNLSRSVHILEKTHEASFINEATVKIYVNNVFKENLQLTTNGNYTSTFTVTANTNLTIIAEHPLYNQVKATETVPEQVDIIKIDTLTIPKIQDENGSNKVFRITFKDNGTTENYYMLHATRKVRYNNSDTSIDSHTQQQNITSTDQSIQHESHLYGLFFNDQYFNGRQYVLNTRLNEYYESDPMYISEDSIIFTLYNVSKDLYLYLISRDNNRYNNNNPLSEPVIVNTNIQNGLGIFGAVSGSEKGFKIAP